MNRIEQKARSRHGLTATKARVKLRGLAAIDRRTAAARALLAWRNELLADLGGEEILSAQKKVLVELAARTRLLLDAVDAWLLEQSSVVNSRKRAILPVLKERQMIADALARYLTALGLERHEKPAPSLEAYLAHKSRQTSSNAPLEANE